MRPRLNSGVLGENQMVPNTCGWLTGGDRIAKRTFLGLALSCFACFGWYVDSASAQAPSAAELAQKAQDPLADITALMTDNTIGFNQGLGDDTGYNFQLQPVKSFDTAYGFRLIPRGIIPIVGAPVGSDFAFLGDLGGAPVIAPTSTTTTWGLSDAMVQVFIAPETAGNIKWGIGPQASLKTHTDSVLKGPSWGGGVAAVIFGSLGNIAWGAVANQHWGDSGDFNVLGVQPILFYNFESLPGAYLGYNNTITVDWEQSGGDRWFVPLGLTAGKTIPVGGSTAVDLSVGGYRLVARPDGAPDWQFKFGISLIQ